LVFGLSGTASIAIRSIHRKPHDPLFFPVGNITKYLYEGLPQHERCGWKHQQAESTLHLLFRQPGSDLAGCEHTSRRDEENPQSKQLWHRRSIELTQETGGGAAGEDRQG
jgi:hypothetical protein